MLLLTAVAIAPQRWLYLCVFSFDGETFHVPMGPCIITVCCLHSCSHGRHSPGADANNFRDHAYVWKDRDADHDYRAGVVPGGSRTVLLVQGWWTNGDDDQLDGHADCGDDSVGTSWEHDFSSHCCGLCG